MEAGTVNEESEDDNNHVRVERALRDLHLPSQIAKWNRQDVKKWLLWEVKEYFMRCLHLMDVDGFQLVGLDLCSLQVRVPNFAKFLFQELKEWMLVLNDLQGLVTTTAKTLPNDVSRTLQLTPPQSTKPDASRDISTKPDASRDTSRNNTPVSQVSPGPKHPEELRTSGQKVENETQGKKQKLHRSLSHQSAPSEAELMRDHHIPPTDSHEIQLGGPSSDLPKPSENVHPGDCPSPSMNSPPPLLPIVTANSVKNAALPEFIRFPWGGQMPQRPPFPLALNSMPPSSLPGVPIPQSFFSNIPLMYGNLNRLPLPGPLPPNLFSLNLQGFGSTMGLQNGHFPRFLSPNLPHQVIKQPASLPTHCEAPPGMQGRENLVRGEAPMFLTPRRRPRGGRGGKRAPALEKLPSTTECKSEPVTPLSASETTMPVLTPNILHTSTIPEFMQNVPSRANNQPINFSASTEISDNYVSLKRSAVNTSGHECDSQNHPENTAEKLVKSEFQNITMDLSDKKTLSKGEYSSPFNGVFVKMEEDEDTPEFRHVEPQYSDVSGTDSDGDEEMVSKKIKESELKSYDTHIPNLFPFHEEPSSSHAHGGQPSCSGISSSNSNLPVMTELKQVVTVSEPWPSTAASAPPVKIPRKRGRPPGSRTLTRPLRTSDVINGEKSTHLWRFLLELLEQPDKYATLLKWLDRAKGLFKILNSGTVAGMWGERKRNGKMTYDKFSRSIRQYYKKGIIIKTKPSKLIYQFGPEYFDPSEG